MENNGICKELGFDGHYPISIYKDIVLVRVVIPHEGLNYTYKFQTLVDREDTECVWHDRYFNTEDGSPTQYMKDIIAVLSDNKDFGNDIDEMEIYFNYLHEIPYIQ